MYGNGDLVGKSCAQARSDSLANCPGLGDAPIRVVVISKAGAATHVLENCAKSVAEVHQGRLVRAGRDHSAYASQDAAGGLLNVVRFLSVFTDDGIQFLVQLHELLAHAPVGCEKHEHERRDAE